MVVILILTRSRRLWQAANPKWVRASRLPGLQPPIRFVSTPPMGSSHALLKFGISNVLPFLGVGFTTLLLGITGRTTLFYGFTPLFCFGLAAFLSDFPTALPLRLFLRSTMRGCRMTTAFFFPKPSPFVPRAALARFVFFLPPACFRFLAILLRSPPDPHPPLRCGFFRFRHDFNLAAPAGFLLPYPVFGRFPAFPLFPCPFAARSLFVNALFDVVNGLTGKPALSASAHPPAAAQGIVGFVDGLENFLSIRGRIKVGVALECLLAKRAPDFIQAGIFC